MTATNANASTDTEYYCENCDSHQIFGDEEGDEWMCVCGDPEPSIANLFHMNNDYEMFPRTFPRKSA